MEDIFTLEDRENSDRYDSLGPEYFAARRMARRFMEAFGADNFKPLIDEFTKRFNDELWTGVVASLIDDTESNIQLETSRMVEGTVRAILSGERWALNRYVLASKYDSGSVREAVVKHIPKELQDARITDLEAEIAQLRSDLKYYRER